MTMTSPENTCPPSALPHAKTCPSASTQTENSEPAATDFINLLDNAFTGLGVFWNVNDTKFLVNSFQIIALGEYKSNYSRILT